MDEDYYSENMTELEDYDPLNPFDYEEFRRYQYLVTFVQRYIVCIVKLLFCILIIANNNLLIYVILKFKRLQTKTNYIILNFAVTTLLWSMSSSISSILEALGYRYFHTILHDLSFSTVVLTAEVSSLLSLLLALDWYISANVQSLLPQYQKSYKWIIVISYLIPLLINFPIFISPRHNNITRTRLCAYISVTIHGICFLMTGIIDIIKCRKTYTREALRTVYALYMSNIYFLMGLPFVLMAIGFLLESVIEFSFPSVVILGIIIYCFELFALLSPIVIVVMLVKLDKNFKISFDTILKRSVRNYAHSDDNYNIDVDDPSV